MIAARVGGFFRAAIERMNGTELEAQCASVVGWLLATGARPSTHDVIAVCRARTGHAPAYGTVARVLAMLRAAGVASWTTAYVRRFHGDRPNDGAPVPVRQLGAYRRARTGKHASGSFLLPVRNLALVGFAATIAAGGIAASRAASIDSELNRLASRVRVARADSPAPSTRSVETRPSLSIESAPRAASPLDEAESAEVPASLLAWFSRSSGG